ncbi:MAG: uracil permease, partial [Eubacteriaceae bacterium]|nr:uracil permease [Eubacteriaceae bacterium]
MKNQRIIQVEEKLPLKMMVPLSLQHMFAMFGASVLVPFLFGINPAIVLFMNGVGTLLFMFITKGKAPAYLGSSFAFLAPAGVVIASWGYAYALGGFVVVGLCGCILAGVIYKFGTAWIDVVLPPAAMGPVVALIGLELASTAASTGGIITQTSYVLDEASGLYEQVVTAINPNNVIVFMVTLAFAVFGSVVFKKFLSVIP